jgi:hypothetical protein
VVTTGRLDETVGEDVHVDRIFRHGRRP